MPRRAPCVLPAFALVVALVVALGACRDASPKTELTGEIFASRWRVVIPEVLPSSASTSLESDVEATLRAVEGRLSAWKRDAEIVRCHDVGAGVPCPVSAETAEVVRACLDVGAATSGAFDITVGPLLDAWGFSPSTKGRPHEAPSPAAIAEALRRVDASAISVTAAPAIIRARDDVRIDVTAVTDGAAARDVARLLWAAGRRHFLVDVAGEVVAAGNADGRPGGRGWRVGISDPGRHADERPGDDDRAARNVVLAASAGMRALSTSGTTRETREAGGRTVSHILDPRTGEPIVTELVSCSILGDDAVVVDALSTACLVLGRARMEEALAGAPRFRGMSALYGFADGRFEPGVGWAAGSAAP